jgi:hypothetical protein
MKTSEILFWDVSTCQSNTVDFIGQLQRTRKTAFAQIVVISPDPTVLPPAIEDVAISFPLTIRLGVNALQEALVDAIAFFTQTKGHATYVVITNVFPLWITLFQRIEPKSVTFISSKDPARSLEFSFLPEKVTVRTLGWPQLEQPGADGNEESISLSMALPADTLVTLSGDGEEERELQGSDDSASLPEEESCRSSARVVPPIQPLVETASHEIDLFSPASSASSCRKAKVSPPKKQAVATREQPTMQLSAKFRPLVEAMRGMGKAMISVTDLEAPLKALSAKLNEPVENLGSYLAKAADAQIIIYDKSTNYLRFRSRGLATSAVDYV